MQAVAVPARIAVDNAVQVLAGLREAIGGVSGGALALDLSPLREFDSSALSLLLQLARDRSPAAEGSTAAAPQRAPAHDAGRNDGPAAFASPLLFLLNPPEKLRELAELYGVAPMLFGAPGGAPDQPQPA
jgi:ABC-type transporter Mla MlaB component